MIARVTGVLESLDGQTAVLVAGDADGGAGAGIAFAIDVLLTAHGARQVIDRVGERITLHTHTVLESPNQGASFVPRLLGFTSPLERSFFDLLTTVKGIGNRKALRAMAEPTSAIAGALHRGDAKALTNLPEIGKRLAESMIVELKGRLEPFLAAGDTATPISVRRAPEATIEITLTEPQQEAVEVLVRLGEQRAEAGRKVARAVERAEHRGARPSTPDEIVAAVFAGR